MPAILTFVIPVRHSRNSADRSEAKRNLASTIASVAAQTQPGWKAVIVANEGTDLPELPTGFEVKWVNLPPNPAHDRDTADRETYFASLGRDKGSRVLAGMLHAGKTGHFMVVDDDDFVSRKLVDFVARHPTANGWYVRDGYLWGHRGKLLSSYSDFSEFCGTSLIVRSDLYALPESLEAAGPEYLRYLLGSHKFIKPHLERAGSPLAPLPFHGAVYRIGHSGSWSKSRSFLRFVLVRKAFLGNPLEFLRSLLGLRYLGPSLRQEFFGGNVV